MANRYQLTPNNGQTVVASSSSYTSIADATADLQTTDFNAITKQDDVNGDGSLIVEYFQIVGTDNQGNTTVSYTSPDGSPYTPVSPIQAVTNPVDFETVALCFRDNDDPNLVYSRVQIFNMTTKAVVLTTWNDKNGAVIAEPANYVSCGVPFIKEFEAKSYMMTAAGTIPAGANSVGIYNDGTADATVQGNILKPGGVEEFTIDGGLSGVLGEITIGGAGINLRITETR